MEVANTGAYGVKPLKKKSMSDWQHHSLDEAFSPIGARRYLNFPWGNKNVVTLELSSSNPSWKQPCTASSFANTVASLGTTCSISFVLLNG